MVEIARDHLPLTTERLILRRFRLDDAATLHAYRNDPITLRYQSWDSWSWQQTEELIDDMAHRRLLRPGTWSQIALELRPPAEEVPAHIGDVAVRLDDTATQAEIGFTLALAARGRGYATEGVAGILGLLFDIMSLHRVAATTDAHNTASMGVLARLGFRQEGRFVESYHDRGVWRDICTFALLAREWRAGADGAALPPDVP